MANTFLAAKGKNMQASLVEGDKLALARTLLEKAEAKGVEVLLPVDLVVAASTQAGPHETELVGVGDVPAGEKGRDIGPRSVVLFTKSFDKAKTIFWNGPMGLFEKAPFAGGTFAVARAMAASRAFTVVGG